MKLISRRNNTLNVLMTLLVGILSVASLGADEVYLVSDPDNQMVAFAVGDIQQALSSKNHTPKITATLEQVPDDADLRIVLKVVGKADAGDSLKELKPEGFAIRRVQNGDQNTFWVYGSDAAGVMYGGLELAEVISIGDLEAIKDDQQNPYMSKRGTKFNIPLDLRTPSYTDMSDAGQQKHWPDVGVGVLDGLHRSPRSLSLQPHFVVEPTPVSLDGKSAGV